MAAKEMVWTYPVGAGDSGIFEIGRRLAEALGRAPDATRFTYDPRAMLRTTRDIERASTGGRLPVGFQAIAPPRRQASQHVDAFDWVVTPNVIGMSQFATGGTFTSKPYVSGGAYLDRMGDHCGRCPYDPRLSTGPDACPFTTLYWDFVDRHAERFRANLRMATIVAAWQRRDEAARTAIRARAVEVRAMTDAGTL